MEYIIIQIAKILFGVGISLIVTAAIRYSKGL